MISYVVSDTTFMAQFEKSQTSNLVQVLLSLVKDHVHVA